jgi:hypothetical protein
MRKSSISINPSKFAKIHATIKKFEKENKAIKIGKMSLSNFLVANTDILTPVTENIETRTKRIILQIAGNYSKDPQKLQNSVQLRGDLGYGDDEYYLLQIRLDKLVKEYNKTAGINSTEANDCEKVGDCVSLVISKTSPSS